MNGGSIAVFIVAAFMLMAWGVRAVELGPLKAFVEYGIVLLAAALMTASAVRSSLGK